MEKCRRVLGPEHPNTFITTINTGGVLQAQGRNAEAVKVLDGVEPAARNAFTGANVRWVAKLLTRRGRARTALGSLDAAEKDLLEAYPLFVSSRGEKHKETRECVQALAALAAARQAAEPGHEDEEGVARAAERRVEKEDVEQDDHRDDDGQLAHGAPLVLELSAELEERPGRHLGLEGRERGFRVGRETAEVAPSHVRFDDDPAHSLLAAHLHRAFHRLHRGDFAERNA